jgi:hypothetical protein
VRAYWGRFRRKSLFLGRPDAEQSVASRLCCAAREVFSRLARVAFGKGGPRARAWNQPLCGQRFKEQIPRRSGAPRRGPLPTSIWHGKSFMPPCGTRKDENRMMVASRCLCHYFGFGTTEACNSTASLPPHSGGKGGVVAPFPDCGAFFSEQGAATGRPGTPAASAQRTITETLPKNKDLWKNLPQ